MLFRWIWNIWKFIKIITQGDNKYGQSIRAEAQAGKLRTKTANDIKTQIRKEFDNKKDAVKYQDKLRDKYRGMYGDDLLPGNKEHLKGKRK